MTSLIEPRQRKLIADIQATEFDHLQTSNSQAHCYLDNAGTTLPSRLLVEAAMRRAINRPLGNPHSSSYSSASGISIEQSRGQILDFFGAPRDEYDVVFTSGATAALKLVGETFPFGNSGCFAYPSNAHTSVLGLRCFTKRAFCIPSDNLHDMKVDSTSSPHGIASKQIRSLCQDRLFSGLESDANAQLSRDDDFNLLALTGECNFNGRKANLQGLFDRINDDQGSENHKTVRTGEESWLNNLGAIKIKDEYVEMTSNSQAALSRNRRWLWLLDASKLAATSPINIRSTFPNKSHRPHFITVSFYKIFGWPTGSGALIIKRSCAPLLRKKYFGGGTISAASAMVDFSIPRFYMSDHPPHTWLEDGTPNIYGITSLPLGIEFINRCGGMEVIQLYTMELTYYLVKRMKSMMHYNDNDNNKEYRQETNLKAETRRKAPLCILYGHHSLPSSSLDEGSSSDDEITFPPPSLSDFKQYISSQGPVIAFNLLWADGSPIGFSEVSRLANEHGIHLRSGCMCNVGACQQDVGITFSDLQRGLSAGRQCSSDVADIVDGRATGAVRISLGVSTSRGDCDKFLSFLSSNFLNKTNPMILPFPLDWTLSLSNNETKNASQETLQVSEIIVYPIKSVGGASVTTWPLLPWGLLLDRFFALMDINGKIVTQKKAPVLAGLKCHLEPVYGSMKETEHLHGGEGEGGGGGGRLGGGGVFIGAIMTVSCVSDYAVQPTQMPSRPLVIHLRFNVRGDVVQAIVENDSNGIKDEQGIKEEGDNDNTHIWGGDNILKNGHDMGVKSEDLQGCHRLLPCGNKRNVLSREMDNIANKWFSDILGYPVYLMRVERNGKTDEREVTSENKIIPPTLQSFANQGSFLLVCEESVTYLNTIIDKGTQQMKSGGGNDEQLVPAISVNNFRPNLVVRGGTPLQEDLWTSLQVEIASQQQAAFTNMPTAVVLTVDEDCRRCSVINVDEKGHNHKSIFQWLLNYRKSQGRKDAHFGKYLSVYTSEAYDDIHDYFPPTWIQVGAKVTASSESS